MFAYLYDLNKLQTYANNTFILERTITQNISYTYGQINSIVEDILYKFQEYNIKQNVGIAVLIKQHTPATCALLLAILNYSCHFYVPDLSITASELYKHLQMIGIQYAISLKRFASLELILDFQILKQLFYLNSIKKSNACQMSLPPNMCYTIATSGSTSTPKVVHVPYDCIHINVTSLSERLQLNATDIIYLCAPPTFDPFVIEYFLALYNGATLLVSSADIRLAPNKLLDILFPINYKPGITLLQMTPSLFRRFGMDAIRERILSANSSLKILLLGGEEFPKIEELKTWLTSNISKDKQLYNIYGITELSCWSTILKITTLDISRISLGAPIDDSIELRVVAKNGELINTEGYGELWLGSAKRRCFIPAIDGEFNSTAVESVYRATGDLVYKDLHANIYFVSRLNETVKRSGKRLCLTTVAQKIQQICNNQAEVHCLWQAEQQKLMCVLHELHADSSKLERQELKAIILSKLAAHEQPDKFIYIDDLPLNAHGKLNRRALAKLCQQKLQNYCCPLAIFEDFLNNTLGIDTLNFNKKFSYKKPRNALRASFREVGGTSFHALSLATEMQQLMACAEQQRQLLSMLLDDKFNIEELFNFLRHVKLKSLLEIPAAMLPAPSVCCQNKRLRLSHTWQLDYKKCIDAAVALFDNYYICVGSHSHLLQTVNATSGQIISSIELPDRIECKVTFITKELAVVGCYDGCLYAFQPIIGQILWSVALNGMIKAQPLLCADDCIIVCNYSKQANVVCVSWRTQSILWRISIGNKGIYAAPIHLDVDSILISTLDGSYARLFTANGHISWRQKCATPIFATPALLFKLKRFALAEVSGCVHICDNVNGQRLISLQISGNIFSSFALASHNNVQNICLIFGCHDQQIYCLHYAEKNSLDLRWSTPLNAAIFATPLILEQHSQRYVLCCTTQGLVALLDLLTGVVVAKYEIHAEIFSSACCLNNTKIYFGCRDNFLYCLTIEDIA